MVLSPVPHKIGRESCHAVNAVVGVREGAKLKSGGSQNRHCINARKRGAWADDLDESHHGSNSIKAIAQAHMRGIGVYVARMRSSRLGAGREKCRLALPEAADTDEEETRNIRGWAHIPIGRQASLRSIAVLRACVEMQVFVCTYRVQLPAN